jgi:hypothetical protein
MGRYPQCGRESEMTIGSGNRASKSTRQELSPSLVQDSLLDLRYSIRGLWRAPVFTLVTILTLALGIGATTAVFTVVHGVLIRPLPFHDSDALGEPEAHGEERERGPARRDEPFAVPQLCAREPVLAHVGVWSRGAAFG